MHDDFFQLGHSLPATKLIDCPDARSFSHRFTPSILFDKPTIREIVNHIIDSWGNAEIVAFSTFFHVDKDYEFNIPIGTPIANSTAYIIDKYEHLQPVGVMGELCVGGEGIARGYLNHPELTSERFIFFPNFPISSFLNFPLYRTGD